MREHGSLRRGLAASLRLVAGFGLCYLGFAQAVAGLAQMRGAAAIASFTASLPDRAPAARAAIEAEYLFADGWWPEPRNAIELGRSNLEAARSDTAADPAAIRLALRYLARGLADAPANAAAWFWLADARFLAQDSRFDIEDNPRAPIAPFVMSITLARFDPALLVWRCQLGLALYRELDAAEKERLADQIRLLARVSIDSLVRVARASQLMPVVVGALRSDPAALNAFANRLYYLK